MGVLPGFFDLTRITLADIVAICAVSMLVPLIGNVFFALFVGRMRRLINTPTALRRMNSGAGIMLIFVGLVIPFV